MCVQGILCKDVKRPDREADKSPPSSAEFKNEWSYTSSSTSYALMACTRTAFRLYLLIKYLNFASVINKYQADTMEGEEEAV